MWVANHFPDYGQGKVDGTGFYVKNTLQGDLNCSR